MIQEKNELEQKLVEIIDTWYFGWKSRFPNTPFGFAKEDLKKIIYYELFYEKVLKKPESSKTEAN